MTTCILAELIGALFFGCLISTMVLTPAVIRFARRIDAVDRGGYRKVFQGEMPLLGGLAIAAPLILLGFVAGIAGHVIIRNWEWVWIHHKGLFDPLLRLAGSRNESMTLAMGGVAVVALGWIDDAKGLRARWKLLGQMVVALFVYVSGHTITTVSIPFVGALELGPGAGGLLTMLWIVGLINAFNLVDGVDGLAAGVALIGAAALVVLGVIQENAYVTLAGAAVAGSLLAFLPYNFPPARIFLGDTGSMFLGYALAMLSLMGAQKSEAAMILLPPMLALSLPIFEMLISIARRYAGGVPVFAGDNRHTHHRLLHKGYSQRKVVLTLYAAALLLAAAAVMSASISEDSAWSWCPYPLYLGTLVYIAWLAGYLRPTTLKKILERRHRNKVFQALAKYAALRLNARMGSVETNLLLELCRRELGLRHIEVRMKSGDRLMASADNAGGDRTQASQEELLVKSSEGLDILICYEFTQAPNPERRQDVSLCLARIFDGIRSGQAGNP